MSLCECGCGETPRPANQTDHARGNKKGEPVRYVRGHNRRRTPHAYEVDAATGCWVWVRAINNKGYGVMGGVGRNVYAHRHYYEEAKGPIPEGLVLDHLCRNPPCVNPDHLEAVTQAENNRRGMRTKLTEDDVHAIRAFSGTASAAAAYFGISRSSVSAIRTGRSWRWVSWDRAPA